MPITFGSFKTKFYNIAQKEFDPQAKKLIHDSEKIIKQMNPLERTPITDVVLSPKERQQGIAEEVRRMVSSNMTVPHINGISESAQKAAIDVMAEAKKINPTLSQKLKQATEHSISGSTVAARPKYTPETILEIVKANENDADFAKHLSKYLNKSSLFKHTPGSLYELSKTEPKIAEIVGKYVDKEVSHGAQVLTDLKHISPARVKNYSTKFVEQVEKLASKNEKGVDEVLNNKTLSSVIDKYDPKYANETLVKFIESASENPESAERVITKINHAIEKKNAINPNSVVFNNVGVNEMTEIVKLHNTNPELVESIIDKFGIYNSRDVKVILDYAQKGKNVDKYVREYLHNNTKRTKNYNLKQYIEFRLKTGSLFDKMLKGKNDSEIAKLYNEQFNNTSRHNNNEVLERIYRDGWQPKSSEELEELTKVYNLYPNTKITNEMFQNIKHTKKL